MSDRFSQMDSCAIGERIKEIRKTANMNKQEFAKELGISPAYITYLESGIKGGEPTNPSDKILEIISHKFGVGFQWLKFGIGTMQSSCRQRILAKLWVVEEQDLNDLYEVIDKFIRERKGQEPAPSSHVKR
ncbi:MAG: helix-turn-helix domain-containing protein [Desulfobacteraceae bacterium]|nr:helix-turn-helix domain-containing protein [Desulfobacteraceae bacterium]